MAYDVTQKATVGQLKALALKAKDAIDSAIQDIPTEMFLDQAKTQFIPNFVFNSTTYAGAANPNLDGKPVLVLAVKGIDHNNGDAETLTYSFLDVSALVDTYTVKSTSANVLSISGYEIELKVSTAANQALTVKSDGLHVDISAKVDKVTSATSGNLPKFGASGALADSGIAVSKLLTTDDVATDAEVNEMLTEVFGA